MAERIEMPPMLQGDTKMQLQQLWNYLYKTSEAINSNMEAIGQNELTDRDRLVMNNILKDTGEKAPSSSEFETLKSLIIKTADYVQKTLNGYQDNLITNSVASGQFGRYVRQTGVDVATDLSGDTDIFQLETILQGLKLYALGARNYIYTGVLRTVSDVPIYGVAIGKDVVTYGIDGTETYNDGNKVAEFTEDESGIYIGGEQIAGWTDSGGSFIGTETLPVALTGCVKCIESTETDFDDLTGEGKIRVDLSSMSHGPTGLSTGIAEVDVTEVMPEESQTPGVYTQIIRQRIYTADSIYTRTKAGGSWGGWYQFTGVAV